MARLNYTENSYIIYCLNELFQKPHGTYKAHCVVTSLA